MSTTGALTWFARSAVALVWLYNGLWLKLLATSPEHRQVVESLPIPAGTALALLAAIGVLETLLALWVLSGRYTRRAALVQTGLLIAMNAGGLIFSAEAIEDPTAMIIQNLALVALIWLLAAREQEE